MEKKVASFNEYEIFMADKSSLHEIADFVVRENYSQYLIPRCIYAPKVKSKLIYK